MEPAETPRQSRRVELKVAVHIERESRLQKFYSRNLSLGGIFLEIDNDPPAIGSTLRISFEVPALKRTISAQAEVVHHHSFTEFDEERGETSKRGIGLRFVELAEEDRTLLDRYVTGKDLRVRP